MVARLAQGQDRGGFGRLAGGAGKRCAPAFQRRDTLPSAPVKSLAVLRLDGDLYESTMDALTHLYPRLEKGGYAIIDDYASVKACQQAVNDYRAAHGITEEIITIDSSGVMWRKESKRRA